MTWPVRLDLTNHHLSLLSERDTVILSVIIAFSCLLSLVGSSFVLTSYTLFSALRTFRLRIIFFLTLTDVGVALSWLLGIVSFGHDSDECVAQGFALQFFVLSSCLWTSCFAVTLLGMWNGNENVEAYEKYYHVVSWGVPALVSLFLLYEGVLGPAGGWCWVDQSERYYRAVYVLNVLLALFNFGVYLKICLGIRKEMSWMKTESLSKGKGLLMHEHKVQWNFCLYLLVYVLLQFPGFINRTLEFFRPTSQCLELYYVQAACEPLQGFLNFMLYAFNKRIVSQYHSVFCLGALGSEVEDYHDIGSYSEWERRDSRHHSLLHANVGGRSMSLASSSSSGKEPMSASESLARSVAVLQEQINQLKDQMPSFKDQTVQDHMHDQMSCLSASLSSLRRQLVLSQMSKRW